MSGQVKSKIRETYENIAGIVSDRQWRRIRREVGIESLADEQKVCPHVLKDVQAYAALRKMYPRSPIDPMDLTLYKAFLEHFPLDGCEGKDLLQSIQQLLKPTPDDRTIRGWGYAIECPLYLHKWYEKSDLEKWVSKMLTQRRFRVTATLPRCKRAEVFL